jgi:hypothetical protein
MAIQVVLANFDTADKIDPSRATLTVTLLTAEGDDRSASGLEIALQIEDTTTKMRLSHAEADILALALDKVIYDNGRRINIVNPNTNLN